MTLAHPSSQPLPRPGAARLEEVCAAEGPDVAAALMFGLHGLKAPAYGAKTVLRPLLFAAPRAWLAERGRPYGWGFGGRGTGPLILVAADKEADALWAVEEALKSGAVGAAVVCAEHPSLLATRRIDHAARAGGASGLILRARPPDDLSAAWRRWRIAALPSAPAMDDAKAPGAPRLMAELVRSRDARPGQWILEWDDASDGFRVAEGLADHGLVEGPRTVAA